MPLQALLWDVDGTLAETEEGHRAAFNAAFAEAGLPWHWDVPLYADLLAVTGGKERMLAWWQRTDAAAAAAPGATDTLRRLHERKTAHYLAALRSGAIGLRPGVRPLLLQAQAQGLVQAIATTTTLANVTGLLAVGLGDAGSRLFSVIGAGDAVQHKKPAPDIYHWVLARLGIAAGDCLAIEDSAPGVAAARAAGVPVLRVRSRYGGDVAAPGCVACLPGFDGVSLQALRGWHAATTAGA